MRVELIKVTDITWELTGYFEIDDKYIITEKEMKILNCDFKEVESKVVEILKKEFLNGNTDIKSGEICIFYLENMDTGEMSVCMLDYNKPKESFEKILIYAINMLENFEEDFKNEKLLKEYIYYIDCISYFMEKINLESIDINTQYWNDIQYLKKDIERERLNSDEEQITRYKRDIISNMLLHYSSKRTEQFIDAEIVVSLSNFVNDITHESYSKKNDFYYKNILDSSWWGNFEILTDLIKSTLKEFDANLVYCGKIIDFINNEFNVEGVFPTDIFFIKQFLSNAINTLILSTTKLFYDKPDLQNKKNCGLIYLKALIQKNIGYKNEIITMVAGNFKEIDKIGKEIETMRNSLIAHYDISKLEDVKKVQLDIELFKKIYDFSVEIFEVLSLNRYHREKEYYDLIKAQGFKKCMCQNIFMHNENTSFKLDIETYLESLRKNFLKNLIIKD